MSTTTQLLTCPLCEATCGLAVEVSDAGRAVSGRGVGDDVFSAGHPRDGGLTVAGGTDGASVNILTPPEVDPLSGTAVLNGFAVEIEPVP
jgi:hypothetical protein